MKEEPLRLKVLGTSQIKKKKAYASLIAGGSWFTRKQSI